MLAIDDKRTFPHVPVNLNLAEHVLWSGGASDDKVALAVLSSSGAENWSYGRLRKAVLSAGAGLLSEGIRPGQRVLMRVGNTPSFPIVFLGAIAAGLVPVPTSAALGVEEITKIAQRLSPSAIVVEPGVPLPETDIAKFNAAELSKGPPLAKIETTSAKTPAYIVFTSGTSGQPMGVVHAHRAILGRQMMINGWYGLGPDDRMLHAGAFNWTFTLGTGLLDPWTMGATALVLDRDVAPDALPALAKEHEATMIAGAPGVFRRMLKGNLAPLPSLRHALSAGEKLPVSLREKWQSVTGTDIHEAFGQSECSTFISGSPSHAAPSGTLGYAQPGRAVAILGENGPLQRNERGAIAVHRSDPGLMLGYLNDETAPHVDGEWFLTGDQGLMRNDGAIEYQGRTDDLLTAGGFRVSPAEVEAAMLTCPGLEEAAAVDRQVSPDTKVIALHYTSASELDENVLSEHASAHLARYKRPRLFIREQSLPRNANGKLLRKALGPANEDTI